MFSAVTIAAKLSLKVANDLNLDEEKKQVIEYGIFSIVQMMFNLILVLLIGFIFDVGIEALIVSLTVGILRKSSGGAHSSSPNTCIVVGTIVCIVIGLFSKFQVGIYEILIISGLIFIWAYYIVLKLAPVDSLAKPIRTEKKKKRLKKSSIFTLTIYLLFVIVFIMIYGYTRSNLLIGYSISILGGVVWQILSLTKRGHLLVKLIDTFFNK